MTQKRSVTTKALSAYLKTRHTSLSAAIFNLGLNQKLLNNDTVDEATLGQLARLYGLTLDAFVALIEPYDTTPAPTT